MATVRELIEKLSTLDPDARVELEGCDCYGPWVGIITKYDDADGPTVLLERT